MISKLLGVASVGSVLASANIMHRFLSSMAKIMVLAIVCAFMLCALMVGVFVALYFSLVQYGFDPVAVAVVLGAVVSLLTVTIVAATVHQLRCFRDHSAYSLPKSRSDWPDFGNIANAFIDGFLGSKK
ncbi:MAG: hypothetical protein PHW63_05790 [Alphaproteobacteria bacterium]|nr:hypothetical protein [Alphaproteobacteria bacterium]